MTDKIKFVREKLPKEELLAQLAEECSELAQAALKLRRVFDGRNVTPVTEEEAFAKVLEEFADVMLCVKVIGIDSVLNMKKILDIREKKLERWVKRLQEKKD
jgi:NTP pyrophosphatase (non-canonical NTP hydrolase)